MTLKRSPRHAERCSYDPLCCAQLQWDIAQRLFERCQVFWLASRVALAAIVHSRARFTSSLLLLIVFPQAGHGVTRGAKLITYHVEVTPADRTVVAARQEFVESGSSLVGGQVFSLFGFSTSGASSTSSTRSPKWPGDDWKVVNRGYSLLRLLASVGCGVGSAVLVGSAKKKNLHAAPKRKVYNNMGLSVPVSILKLKIIRNLHYSYRTRPAVLILLSKI